MTLGLNREGTKQKYTYQKRITNRSRKVWVDYAAQIHLFEFSPYGERKMAQTKV